MGLTKKHARKVKCKKIAYFDGAMLMIISPPTALITNTE
jgi:hypothetical protein